MTTFIIVLIAISVVTSISLIGGIIYWLVTRESTREHLPPTTEETHTGIANNVEPSMLRSMEDIYKYEPVAVGIPAALIEDVFSNSDISIVSSAVPTDSTQYPIYRYAHTPVKDSRCTRHISDIILPTDMQLHPAAQLYTMKHILQNGHHKFIILSDFMIRMDKISNQQLMQALELEYPIHRARQIIKYTVEYVTQECIEALKIPTKDKEALLLRMNDGLVSLFDVHVDVLQFYRVADLPEFMRDIDMNKLSVLTPIHTMYQLWLLHKGHEMLPIQVLPDVVLITDSPNEQDILTMPIWTQPIELFTTFIYASEHSCIMYPSLHPLITHKTRPYLQVQLHGNVTDQMFQLAALDHLCRSSGRDPSVACKKDQVEVRELDGFLSTWLCFEKVQTVDSIKLVEDTYRMWQPRLDACTTRDVTIVDSFFRCHRYVDADFMKRVCWPAMELSVSDTPRVFIHVQLRDEKLNRLPYYANAIRQFPMGTAFIIFTDDYPYAKSQPWINTLENVAYADNSQSPVEILTHMSLCSGGICTNASLSFWAAYRLKTLLPYRPILIMPNDAVEYHFPGVTLL